MTEALSSVGIQCSEVWGGNRAAAAALTLPGLDGWVLSRPHLDNDAGGDVHYLSSCGTGRITRLMLADVAGHGDAVAELGAKLRRVMQRYLNDVAPGPLARRLNADMGRLVGESGMSGRFATALVVTYWAPTGRLSIVNAGHPPPLIYRRRNHAWDTIAQPTQDDAQQGVTNLPLGVLEDAGYAGRRLTLEAGDVLLAYTDCFIEAQNDAGDLLGERGLIDLANDTLPDTADSFDHTKPGAVIDALVHALDQRGYRTDDDLTAVALRCNGPSGGSGLRATAAGLYRGVKAAVSGQPVPWPELTRSEHL